MLSSKIEKAVNEQINFELYSSYLYLAMSADFTAKNFKGCAVWMRVQAQEEMIHAMKLFDFVNDRGGKAQLMTIEGPKTEWPDLKHAFEDAYKHEQVVTSNFNKLTDLTLKEKDHTSGVFFQWFLNEQIEEEANAKEIVDQLRIIGDNAQGLFMLDRELGTRVFAVPVGAEGVLAKTAGGAAVP